MGGGGKIPYPKWVWSPTGGWYPNPKRWKTNTAVALAWIFVAMVPVFIYSCNNERVVNGPRNDDRWVPSMLWSKDLKRITEERKKRREPSPSDLNINGEETL